MALFAAAVILLTAGRTIFATQAAVSSLGMQLLTAVLTHHMRDAFRRGLWLWPLVNDSIPVSYAFYIVFEAAWPVFLALLWMRGEAGAARQRVALNK